MKNDDLFSESAMSFGEHLDELRTCLWRSVLWLVAGCGLGLFFGGQVVAFIQVPLSQSLETYYLRRATQRLHSIEKTLIDEGHSAEIALIPQTTGMVPREFWIYPGELERLAAISQKEILTQKEIKDIAEIFPAENVAAENTLAEKLIHPDYSAAPQRMILFQKISESEQVSAKSLSSHETFGIYLKASVVVGIFLASPGIIFHLWYFVAAGLYPQERKYVYYFVPFSVFLFLGGALFAFFYVFQVVLDFLLSFNDWLNVTPDLRISDWLSFALMLPLGFGISFQLPLVMLVLDRIGIFRTQDYLAHWRIAVLGIAVLSMFLTPSDPWSMILMAAPLTLLYFLGIALCRLVPRASS